MLNSATIFQATKKEEKKQLLRYARPWVSPPASWTRRGHGREAGVGAYGDLLGHVTLTQACLPGPGTLGQSWVPAGLPTGPGLACFRCSHRGTSSRRQPSQDWSQNNVSKRGSTHPSVGTGDLQVGW